MQFHEKKNYWFIWFHEFQKWPKINFWTGKKFKTAKNAISRKFFFWFIWFHELFCLDFFKFSLKTDPDRVEPILLLLLILVESGSSLGSDPLLDISESCKLFIIVSKVSFDVSLTTSCSFKASDKKMTFWIKW